MSKNLERALTFHGRIKENITDASLMDHIKYSNYGPHYYAAYDIFKNNKLFGIGLKTFRTQCEYAKVPEDISSRKCAIHPHQLYLEMLAEIGIFGFILFFIFFTVIILKSLKTYFKENDLILLSLCAFICSQILPVLPSGSFFTSFSAIIFWTNVSLIYSLLIKYKKI
jgi:O-antigen ligase